MFKVRTVPSRFSWTKKEEPDYLSLPHPDLREKALGRHPLEQPGLATWLGQNTRSKAKHGAEAFTESPSSGLGDSVC